MELRGRSLSGEAYPYLVAVILVSVQCLAPDPEFRVQLALYRPIKGKRKP